MTELYVHCTGVCELKEPDHIQSCALQDKLVRPKERRMQKDSVRHARTRTYWTCTYKSARTAVRAFLSQPIPGRFQSCGSQRELIYPNDGRMQKFGFLRARTRTRHNMHVQLYVHLYLTPIPTDPGAVVHMVNLHIQKIVTCQNSAFCVHKHVCYSMHVQTCTYN